MEDKSKRQITLPEASTFVDITFENMLKDFLRKVKKDGILDEVKRRRYYIKPSLEKRLRKNGRPKRSIQ